MLRVVSLRSSLDVRVTSYATANCALLFPKFMKQARGSANVASMIPMTSTGIINSPTKHLTDGSRDSSWDALGPNTLAASGPLVEKSQPYLAGCRSIESVTETTVCNPRQIR